jgi:hypothetical protein
VFGNNSFSVIFLLAKKEPAPANPISASILLTALFMPTSFQD